MCGQNYGSTRVDIQRLRATPYARPAFLESRSLVELGRNSKVALLVKIAPFSIYHDRNSIFGERVNITIVSHFVNHWDHGTPCAINKAIMALKIFDVGSTIDEAARRPHPQV